MNRRQRRAAHSKGSIGGLSVDQEMQYNEPALADVRRGLAMVEGLLVKNGADNPVIPLNTALAAQSYSWAKLCKPLVPPETMLRLVLGASQERAETPVPRVPANCNHFEQIAMSGLTEYLVGILHKYPVRSLFLAIALQFVDRVKALDKDPVDECDAVLARMKLSEWKAP